MSRYFNCFHVYVSFVYDLDNKVAVYLLLKYGFGGHIFVLDSFNSENYFKFISNRCMELYNCFPLPGRVAG